MGLIAVSWVGTLPAWLTFLGVLAAAYVIWRGGGGTALTTLQTANRILERRVHELEKEQAALRTENAELRGRTDMALAIQPFMAWAESHETHAADRHERTLVVLDLIAARIGPEGS